VEKEETNANSRLHERHFSLTSIENVVVGIGVFFLSILRLFSRCLQQQLLLQLAARGDG